jgi:hypothetical protein
MRGGKRPGAGRKAGARNKRTAEMVAEAAANGMLPHDFLCAVSQGMIVDGHVPTFTERMTAANAAAPFFAPKLSSVDAKHSGKIETGGIDAPPRSENYDEWHARRNRELATVGTAAGSTARSN